MVTVTIHGEKREFAQGTSYETIAADYQKNYDGMIAVVTVNGKIRELFKKVTKDCTVDFSISGQTRLTVLMIARKGLAKVLKKDNCGKLRNSSA